MAKVTPPQEIPSELLADYIKVMGQVRPDDGVRKRYPFRIPPMQTLVGHPTTKQKKQRARFIVAKNNFADVDWPTRQRWYAAAPEWGSFLWYYNYFIMSSLGGNADIPYGGAGVIKSIQFIKEEVPTTGGKAFTINAVDPLKTVVMMFGNSFISDKIQRGSDTIVDGGENFHALSPEVNVDISEVIIKGSGGKESISEGSGVGDWADPYAYALAAAQLTVRQQTSPSQTYTTGYSWQVIEHKAQTIYPVIVSVAAEVVNIDWAKVPSVAADISLIVIEYI